MTSCSAELPGWPWRIFKVAALTLLGLCAVGVAGLVGYERSLARVREHRAALERLVRRYTGLDVRFSELGLRWGWYGPEAIFHQVELDVPGDTVPLVRAPGLVVSLDLWSTLRSGGLAAGRITLLSPDIDLLPQAGGPAPPGHGVQPPCRALSALDRWHGGRIDVEGGTLDVPVPGGQPVSLQIRSASLRRSGQDLSASGLLFLPERLGQAAQVGLQLQGDLTRPATLTGTLRLDAYQLRLRAWRDLVKRLPGLQQDLPRAGQGDVEMAARIAGGALTGASGQVSAEGVELAPLLPHQAGLSLDELRGTWWLKRTPGGWRLDVDRLELGGPSLSGPAHVVLEAGPDLRWASADIEGAPLAPVMEVARWLAPHLKLGGADIEGTVRDLTADWSRDRPPGQTVEARGTLEDVSVSPPSHAFTLGGFSVQVRGSEGDLVAVGQGAARLELAHAPGYRLAVGVHAALRIRETAGGWEVIASRLDLSHQRTRLALKGTLSGGASDPVPFVAARGSLTGADVHLLEQLFGASTARVFGAAASHLTAGRIDDAELFLRGPLDARLLSAAHPERFTGSLTLRDGMLSGGDLWPDAEEVNARIDWRGASIDAQLQSGHAGPFSFVSGEAEWDALGRHPTRLTGRVRGHLQDAVAWLRGHPALEAYAPQVSALALQGDALLDLDVQVPAGIGPTQVRVVARIEQGQLQAVPGLPPLSGLNGTLSLHDGHLLSSVLDGSWLGGAAQLRFSQPSENGTPVIRVQGQGWLDAGDLTFPSIGASQEAPLQGTSDWSGELILLAPHGSAAARWRADAQLTLTGVESELPAPLDKAAGDPVPLKVQAQGTSTKATLQVALGGRLHSVVVLRGSGSGWSIQRGDVQLGIAPAVLPPDPVLEVQGRTAQLDLAPYLFLWRQLKRMPDSPALRADVEAGDVRIADHDYPQVHLTAHRTAQADELQLESPQVMGTVTWALDPDAPAELHLTRLIVPEVATAGRGVAVLAALGPLLHVTVDHLIWAGHSLGQLTASLAAGPRSLDVEDLALAGPTQQGQGTLRCFATDCHLTFVLETSDAAATLLSFGFRPELTASQGSLTGELDWPLDEDLPLGHLRGHVHLALEDGTTRPTAPPANDLPPFPLLCVPALVTALDKTPRGHQGLSSLQFSQLAGDFDLRDGEAFTSNLQLDGDAEILMQGRAGLLTQDYDQQVWILRGEERLPAVVRRLGATQGIAAIWLSLRELFAPHLDRPPTVLHLQGTWDDPIVGAE